ncbi:MAG: CHAT domain-containing protein [Usitatibacter sp.]
MPPSAQHVAKSSHSASNDPLHLEARWIELGYSPFAAGRLREALAGGGLAPRAISHALTLLAVAESHMGNERAARALADRVIAEAAALPTPDRALVWLRLSSVYLRAGIIDKGNALLEDAERLAREAGDSHSEFVAIVNLARGPAAADLRATRVRRMLAILERQPADAEGRGLRLVALRAAVESGVPDPSLAAQLAGIHREASAADDPDSAAQALGTLGDFLLRRGNPAAALDAVDRALGLAGSAGTSPAVEWRWTRARALVARGRPEEALAAYAEAISQARSSRGIGEPALLGLGVTYRERFGSMFLEYADAMLKVSARQPVAQRQRALRSVLEVVELSKAVEVSDYFRDPCIAPEGALRTDAVDSSSAVIYPIIFPDRTELLLSHREGIDQYTVAITREEMGSRVDRFRELLEKRTTRQYLRPARELHRLLIEPIEARLENLGVSVLIVVPDGALRTVPFAALHDGKRHLVEKMAVATSPGLNMTSARPLSGERVQGVVHGLTVARHGFTALPAVAEELERISKTLGAPPIRDEEFTRARLEREMLRGRANVVHIASHGQFSRDVQQTFLLAYDDKFDLDSLRRAISAGKTKEEPLELLTLSACQTALGDDRAALGLAGVALRAGARSALATLWSVSDESTSDLVARFYTELVVNRRPRAEALRAAQLSLLADERFAHAAYWGAFLLIGSWL